MTKEIFAAKGRPWKNGRLHPMEDGNEGNLTGPKRSIEFLQIAAAAFEGRNWLHLSGFKIHAQHERPRKAQGDNFLQQNGEDFLSSLRREQTQGGGLTDRLAALAR